MMIVDNVIIEKGGDVSSETIVVKQKQSRSVIYSNIVYFWQRDLIKDKIKGNFFTRAGIATDPRSDY